MHWLHLLFWLPLGGSLLGDVVKFVTAPFRDAAELAGNVWHAIRSLFIKLRDVFGHVWNAWTSLYNAIVGFGRAAIHFARNVVNAIGWLITTAIPSIGRWAVSKAFKAAKALVLWLEKLLKRSIAWLRTHAERLIHAVEKLARHFYSVLRRAVLNAAHWIATAGRDVWRLVMHPTRLVAWIMPHLVVPLLRFVVDHSVPVVRFLFRIALRESFTLADAIESEIVKLI